jgi:hypothetical protein
MRPSAISAVSLSMEGSEPRKRCRAEAETADSQAALRLKRPARVGDVVLMP